MEELWSELVHNLIIKILTGLLGQLITNKQNESLKETAHRPP